MAYSLSRSSKSVSESDTIVELCGPPGPVGPQGWIGPQGSRGLRGHTGNTGPAGTQPLIGSSVSLAADVDVVPTPPPGVPIPLEGGFARPRTGVTFIEPPSLILDVPGAYTLAVSTLITNDTDDTAIVVLTPIVSTGVVVVEPPEIQTPSFPGVSSDTNYLLLSVTQAPVTLIFGASSAIPINILKYEALTTYIGPE